MGLYAGFTAKNAKSGPKKGNRNLEPEIEGQKGDIGEQLASHVKP